MNCGKCHYDFCWHCLGDFNHEEQTFCPARLVVMRVITVIFIYLLNSKFRNVFDTYANVEDTILEYILATVVIDIYIAAIIAIFPFIYMAYEDYRDGSDTCCESLTLIALTVFRLGVCAAIIIWNSYQFGTDFFGIQIQMLIAQSVIFVIFVAAYFIKEHINRRRYREHEN